MAYPVGLDVAEHPPPGGWGDPDTATVVLVHGSLDRGSSFTRAIRRLADLGVVTYDRRGYEGSPHEGEPFDLAGHVDDLLGIVAALPGRGPVTAVGHSLGGDVVVGAALARPEWFASVGAYEPPMPWLGQWKRRRSSLERDPADEAEAFFRRMVGDAAWDRLPEAVRAQRRAEGPALVADLVAMRGEAPFDVTALGVPAVFGRGGPASAAHHRETVAWLGTHVPGAEVVEIEAAAHGAHLTHPDGFVGLVRTAVSLGAARRHKLMAARPERAAGG